MSAVEPLLPEHLLHLRERNQSANSIRERRFTVLRCARWLGHPVADANRDELRAWRRWLLTEGLAPRSQHNAIVHVSQFLAWLVREDHRPDNPAATLARPKKINDRLPRPISEAQLTRALAEAEQPIRVWLTLGAFCGLRCMEIAGLTREDVVDDDVANLHLRVIGKGNKERLVPLPHIVLAELCAAGMPVSGYLFSRMDGKPGPPSAMRVSERINDHLHTLGIRSTAHALRHRFGTKLYAATRDPYLVAEVMGHTSVDTTRLYVQLNPQAAARSIEEISRLADVITT